MRNTEHMVNHLVVITEIDDKMITEPAHIEDPFHTSILVLEWSVWAWLKVLFTWHRRITIRVKVRGDSVAHARWFTGKDLCEHCLKTDLEDGRGYKHGDERWCEECHTEPRPLSSLPIA